MLVRPMRMRDYIDLFTLVESTRAAGFDPTATYLHGGPEMLVGGKLKRYGRDDSDMGALFFAEDTPEGRAYAAGYAVTKDRGAVWKVRINLSPNDVYDHSNPSHRVRLTRAVGPEMWADMTQGASGQLDWTAVDDELMAEAGFAGALLQERPPGFMGANAVRSVAVFDASHVEIIEKMTREELNDALRGLHRPMAGL